MREFHPWPLVTMHPDTAAEYGIQEGDWVWIETTHGRCRQKAFLFPGIKPNTIHMEHAWWFPEEEAAEPSLYGTFDSNINNMALNFETGQGGIGSGIKSFLAKIYKYQEGDQMPGEKVTREGGWGDYIPGVMAGDKESAEKRAAEGNDALMKQAGERPPRAEPQGGGRRHAGPQRLGVRQGACRRGNQVTDAEREKEANQ